MLSMQSSKDSRSDPVPAQAEANSNRTILLVEDRQSEIDLVEEALRESQILFNLYVVRDGEEASDFLYRRQQYSQAPRPAIIFLDLNLPGMNGIELLSLIKEDANLKTIPVVIFTNSKAPRDISRSYGLHANCYLVKPLDLEQFFRLIQATVRFWFAVATLPP